MSAKRYPEDFKIEAVKQVTDRGYKVAEVAQRLGVTGSTPFSRTVIKRLKTPDHALPIAFAFVDCESAQCS